MLTAYVDGSGMQRGLHRRGASQTSGQHQRHTCACPHAFGVVEKIGFPRAGGLRRPGHHRGRLERAARYLQQIDTRIAEAVDDCHRLLLVEAGVHSDLRAARETLHQTRDFGDGQRSWPREATAQARHLLRGRRNRAAGQTAGYLAPGVVELHPALRAAGAGGSRPGPQRRDVSLVLDHDLARLGDRGAVDYHVAGDHQPASAARPGVIQPHVCAGGFTGERRQLLTHRRLRDTVRQHCATG
ncbi:hypothetical protein ABQF13_16635 [Mycolicibacterium sp. XJ879]